MESYFDSLLTDFRSGGKMYLFANCQFPFKSGHVFINDGRLTNKVNPFVYGTPYNFRLYLKT